MMLARKNPRRLDLSVFAILDFVTNIFSSLINVLIFVRKSGTHIGCSGCSESSGSPNDPLGRSTTGWWRNQEVFPKDLVLSGIWTSGTRRLAVRKREARPQWTAWAMHQCALYIFTKSGPLSNQAKHRCIAHAGYFDKLQDNKHLREKPTELREKPTAFSLKWLYQFS